CEPETLKNPKIMKDGYIRMVIRSYYFQHWENIINQLTRYYYLFIEIPKHQDIKNSSAFFDIQHEFEEKTGISINDYFTVGFGVLANWYRKDLQNFSAIIPLQYFSKTKISDEKVKKCLELFTADIEKYKNEYKKDRMARRMEDSYAFLTMRKFPLFQLEDGKIIPLDIRFLVDKISSNIYWTIMEHQKTNGDRNRFTNFFGEIFEIYVIEIFQRIMHGTNRLHSKINYGKPEKESPEVILDYSPDFIFIDAKTSRLRLETVTTGDLALYNQDLEKCFFDSIKQMSNRINDFKNKEFPINGKHYKDGDKIWPVIVYLDDFPIDPVIWEYLNKKIAELKIPHLKNLEILDINELENIEAILSNNSGLSFLDILKEKNKGPFKNYSMNNYLYKTLKSVYLKIKPWIYSYFDDVISENLMETHFGKANNSSEPVRYPPDSSMKFRLGDLP
ncbi:MAG: hypothetical protein M1269_02945, partial [Chloroflexi bacterium]|nr:hypothetical protein [Chloroflexota bacterium]